MKLTPGIKIALIYFGVGILWIYLSDRILFLFFDYQDEKRHILFQNFKGFFYISVTAFLLYKMIRSYYRSSDIRLKELETKQAELDQVQRLTASGTWEYNILTQLAQWSVQANELFDDSNASDPESGRKLEDNLANESDAGLLRQTIKDAETKGIPFDLKLEIITAKLNRKWLRFSGQPHFEDGICTRVYGSFQDITSVVMADEKIRQLNRLYDFITLINRVIVREKNEQLMFKEICEIAVKTGNFRMAWIGLINPETQELEVSSFAGEENGYLSVFRKISVKDEPEGRGPTGSALRQGIHFVCNDIEHDPRMEPWRSAQLERGYRSSIALPIVKFGHVVGAFTLYAGVTGFFDNEEIGLLKDATADISHAHEKLAVESLRRSAEARVLEALDRYDMISMATSDTIWDWDIPGHSIFYNKGIHTVFGYSSAEILNTVKWREQKIHRNDLSYIKKMMEEIFARRDEKFHATYRFRCADGRYKIISDRFFIRYDESGKPMRVIGTMQDITQEKEYEQRVEKAIVRTQEAERQQVGMELHDNVNQILAATLIYLGVAKEDLKKGKDISRDIDFSEKYTREAVAEIRRLSHQLAPVSVKDISISEAFERLIGTLNAKNLFRVKLNLELLSADILTNELKINLYRILQEQLNNIVKYAKASEVRINLSLHEGMLNFSISDNGRGFDTSISSKGIGLENIRRRTRLLSGDFRLISAPGAGCEIEVDIPVTPDVDNAIETGDAIPVLE